VTRAAKIGLIGGSVVIYLAMTGILERFDQRPVITGVIGLGRTLILVAFFLSGYLAARAPKGQPAEGNRLLTGGVAGLAAGALCGVFVVVLTLLLDAGVNVRGVFIAVTPRMLEIVGFGTTGFMALLIDIAVGLVVGLAGAGVRLLADQWRRSVLYGLAAMLLVSLSEPLLTPIFNGIGLRAVGSFLYESGGLTVAGAIVIFVVSAGLIYSRERFRKVPPPAEEGAPRPVTEKPSVTRNRIVLAIVGVVLVLLPWVVGDRIADILGTVGLYVLLGLGLNIVVGYAGLLDLGYVAFFAVGAYSIAIFTSPQSFLVRPEGGGFAEAGLTNFWVALIPTVIIAVLIGVLIGAPVLRLRGDYLAIVTLGFGEIIRTLVLSDWLAPYLGGAQGITQVPAPPPVALDLRDPQMTYYVILAFGLVAAFIAWRLVDARVGRAWAAMREDESVAEAMGVSVVRYKLLAFAIGAGIGCLGGAFFAAKIGSIFPNSFGLLVSINVLAVIVLGGMGSIPGVVVGALVLVGLPELLREFAEYRLLFYGAILVAIMIFRPEGLIPNRRRRRELHVEKDPSITEDIALATASERI
jgi:branched-chain amino acid transport system permease protein